MDTYHLIVPFYALQTIDENSAQLAEWGVDIATYIGNPQWVIVPVGSVLPTAIVDDDTFQARYAVIA